MKKRLLSVVVAFSLMTAMFSPGAVAAGAQHQEDSGGFRWGDLFREVLASNTGGTDNGYKVNKDTEVDVFIGYVQAGYNVTLTGDITVTQGDVEKITSYGGVFDGGGHQITVTPATSGSLFGLITGEVTRLRVVNQKIGTKSPEGKITRSCDVTTAGTTIYTAANTSGTEMTVEISPHSVKTLEVGDSLTAVVKVGDTVLKTDEVTYEWKLNGKSLSTDANAQLYTLRPADIGTDQEFTCTVTYDLPGGPSVDGKTTITVVEKASTESDTESKTETGTETESNTESKTETGTETESDTESKTETGTETESDTESKTETESDTEMVGDLKLLNSNCTYGDKVTATVTVKNQIANSITIMIPELGVARSIDIQSSRTTSGTLMDGIAEIEIDTVDDRLMPDAGATQAQSFTLIASCGGTELDRKTLNVSWLRNAGNVSLVNRPTEGYEYGKMATLLADNGWKIISDSDFAQSHASDNDWSTTVNTGPNDTAFRYHMKNDTTGRITDALTIDIPRKPDKTIRDENIKSDTIPAGGYIYDGTAKKPEFTIVVDDATLRPNTDYLVTYVHKNAPKQQLDPIDANQDLSNTKDRYVAVITGMNGYTGTVEREFIINKRPIELDALIIDPNHNSEVNGNPGEKVYDGTNSSTGNGLLITMKSGENMGVIDKEKDSVHITANYGYDDAQVGTGKTITAMDFNLAGVKHSNYELVNLPDTGLSAAVGAITPRSLVILSAEAHSRYYDGTDQVEITSISLRGIATLHDGKLDDVKIDTTNLYGTVASPSSGSYTSVRIPTAGLESRLTGTAAGNYVLELADTEGNIPEYLDVSTNVSINKITPGINYPTITPQPLTYGQKLSACRFEGGNGYSVNPDVDLGRGFKWKEEDTRPPAGTSNYPVIFTPNEEVNYESVEFNVSVEVLKANLEENGPIVPTEPYTIKYGQPLSVIELPTLYNPMDSSLPVGGAWVWGEDSTTAPTISGVGHPVEFVLDSTSAGNYLTPSGGNVTVNLEAGAPKLEITANSGGSGDNQYFRPGSTVNVQVTAENSYDTRMENKPMISKITYQFGSDPVQEVPGVSGQTSRFSFAIPIPEGTRNGIALKIWAETAAAENMYTAGSAERTLTITDKDIVTVEAVMQASRVYDGISQDHYLEQPVFRKQNLDGTTQSVTVPRYTTVWRTYPEGLELESAPINAGKYTLEIFVDTDDFVGSTAEPVPFEITKRQLTWPPAGWTSARKNIGETGEVTVRGVLNIQGILQRDRETVTFTAPEMVTSGLADITEAGTYSVDVIPANGSDWGFDPPVLENYEWPKGSPKVNAVVGRPSQTITQPPLPPELAGQENSKMLDLKANIPEEIAAKVKKTVSDLTTLMKQAVMGYNKAVYEENIVVYDLQLLVKDDTGKFVMTEARSDFPEDGKLTVTIAYPTGTSSATPFFTVAHMFTTDNFNQKIGDIEYPAVTKTADGIQFRVTGLSPVAIGWSQTDGTKDDESGSESGSENNGSSGSNGSSSSDKSYSVRVLSTRYGRVGVSSTRAEEGDTITITVTPYRDYVLDDLLVTDSRGREVRTRARSSNRYTFTMPAYNVTIDASFRRSDEVTVSQTSTNTSSGTTSTTSSSSNTAYRPGTWNLTCDGGASCPSHGYPDLNTAMWYHAPVDYVLLRGLMGRMGNGRFGPNETLTRAMLAQILYTQAGTPWAPRTTAFRDVDAGAWYEDAVNWVVSQGIASGVGDSLFAPNAAITREQLAVMLYNYASRRGLTSITSTDAVVSFTDSWNISPWAVSAVSAMQQSNIITGKTSGAFDPKGRATRSETAQMLWNMLK